MGERDFNEFYDVYREFRPETTREEFQRKWDIFQGLKAEHLKKQALQ